MTGTVPPVILKKDEGIRIHEGPWAMKLEKDPAAFLIRSDAALDVLSALRNGKPHRPTEVRRAIGEMHPQVMREVISNLGTLGLAHLRVLPGSKPTKVPRGVALPVVLEITKKGQDVLRHVNHYRQLVKRDRAILPQATIERWLTARPSRQTGPLPVPPRSSPT